MRDFLKRLLRALSTFFAFVRMTIANVACMALIGVVLFYLCVPTTVRIEDGSTLLVTLSGTVREETTLSDEELLLTQALGEPQKETCLRQVTEALRRAKTDDRIRSVLLRVDDLTKVGLAAQREIGLAMDDFKRSGKRITLWAQTLSQKQYLIAAHASEVFLHPMGEVLLTGLSSDRLYWGELLKKLGVTVHVFKAGAYKSFPESFTRQSASRESLEADRLWINDAWKEVARGIESARGLMPGTVHRYIENLEDELIDAQGNMSTVALKCNLIDAVKTLDDVRRVLSERQGGKKEESQLKTVHYLDYLDTFGVKEPSQKTVAVLTLEGDIRESRSEAGFVGARDVVRRIQAVRKDPSVASLLVRVNSPGGSALASEMIRNELELTKKAGKPVVISMSDMAASGGYWISTAGSVIYADPLTITGSIGVFGLLPTFEKALDKFSVGVDGVRTEWLSGVQNPLRQLNPRYGKILDLTVARTYNDFVKLVADARHKSPGEIEPLAQGRVYTGKIAYEYGLVDALGGFDDALNKAKELGHVEKEATPHWLKKETPIFSGFVGRLMARLNIRSLLFRPVEKIYSQGERFLQCASESNGILAHAIFIGDGTN